MGRIRLSHSSGDALARFCFDVLQACRILIMKPLCLGKRGVDLIVYFRHACFTLSKHLLECRTAEYRNVHKPEQGGEQEKADALRYKDLRVFYRYGAKLKFAK